MYDDDDMKKKKTFLDRQPRYLDIAVTILYGRSKYQGIKIIDIILIFPISTYLGYVNETQPIKMSNCQATTDDPSLHCIGRLHRLHRLDKALKNSGKRNQIVLEFCQNFKVILLPTDY